MPKENEAAIVAMVLSAVIILFLITGSHKVFKGIGSAFGLVKSFAFPYKKFILLIHHLTTDLWEWPLHCIPPA